MVSGFLAGNGELPNVQQFSPDQVQFSRTLILLFVIHFVGTNEMTPGFPHYSIKENLIRNYFSAEDGNIIEVINPKTNSSG